MPGKCKVEIVQDARPRDNGSQADSVNEGLEAIYPQLRALAGSWWFREPTDHTLSPTAVVHEAYLALRRSAPDTERGRAYFFAAAAQAMRRVLVDHARRRSRRPEVCRVSIEGLAKDEHPQVSVLELDDALCELAREHPRSARGAEYRLFAGMSPAQIVAVLDVSERTVQLDWRFARSFLRARLWGDE
jgi:RNA polymerase sigma factor (TIGR02999 family)